MYALCVSAAVNTQGFVWRILCAIYTFSFIHSFIHSFIQGGDVNGHFDIDVNTGAITTTTQLNADAIASYTLTVTATDRGGGSGALTSTAVVLVTVTGVNQYDPVFTQVTYTATTAETTPVGTQLVQVSLLGALVGTRVV